MNRILSKEFYKELLSQVEQAFGENITPQKDNMFKLTECFSNAIGNCLSGTEVESVRVRGLGFFSKKTYVVPESGDWHSIETSPPSSTCKIKNRVGFKVSKTLQAKLNSELDNVTKEKVETIEPELKNEKE